MFLCRMVGVWGRWVVKTQNDADCELIVLGYRNVQVGDVELLTRGGRGPPGSALGDSGGKGLPGELARQIRGQVVSKFNIFLMPFLPSSGPV